MQAKSTSVISQDALLKKQEQHLFKYAVKAPVFVMLLAIMLFTTQFFVFGESYLFEWFMVVSAVSLARLLLAIAYRAQRFPGVSSKRWINLYIYAVCLTGALCGVAVFLIPGDRLELHFLTLLVVSGVMSGAMPMVAIIRNVYPVYVVLILAPYIVQYIHFGSPIYLTIIVFMVIYGLFMILTSRETHENYIEIVRLQIAEGENARLDMLTGVANRRAFVEIYANEWKHAQRAGYPLSIMLIDVDEFKSYNDHYGHIMGDECLRRIASTISNSLERDTDKVARYGGEEFTVILPSTDARAGQTIAERLRGAVAKLAIPHARSKTANYVTISIGGITRIPTLDLTPGEFLTEADTLLYKSKHNGRNRVSWAMNSA
ncbi:diguanylate cyclase [Sulfuriflexus mobilis]|uniref:diguanylate cyclase n=1 Tax=Sulfuriflexus mobilis TaxID=1811807 RepID=UPI00155943BC|nr:diguanylate cyclase [Sulfuriflexus mobilis]